MLQVPLTDEAWQKVSHLFEYVVSSRPGRPRRHPRSILDAILWVHLNREKWHRLPTSFPPAQTCYLKWLEWNRAGIMAQVLGALEIPDQSAEPAAAEPQ
jgi:transposase